MQGKLCRAGQAAQCSYFRQLSKSHCTVDAVDHLGCGMNRQRVLGKTRSRPNVASHFPGDRKLLIRPLGEQRDNQISRAITRTRR